jgi:hypothetical protein
LDIRKALEERMVGKGIVESCEKSTNALKSKFGHVFGGFFQEKQVLAETSGAKLSGILVLILGG